MALNMRIPVISFHLLALRLLIMLTYWRQKCMQNLWVL